MAFERWALDQAHIIDDQCEWRLGDTREESVDGHGMVNAFAIVSSDHLHLRFVVDRGVSHLDVGCLDETGLRRWVPFEVVGFAAGLWGNEEYRQAKREALESLDFESEKPPAIKLFSDSSAQVGANMRKIVKAADDPRTVGQAEIAISEMNAEILRSLDVVPSLGDARSTEMVVRDVDELTQQGPFLEEQEGELG